MELFFFWPVKKSLIGAQRSDRSFPLQLCRMIYSSLHHSGLRVSVRSLFLRHYQSQPRLFVHSSMADHTPREEHLPVYPGLDLNNGRYTIRRKLGEGVFSATYLVEDVEVECDPKRWRVERFT